MRLAREGYRGGLGGTGFFRQECGFREPARDRAGPVGPSSRGSTAVRSAGPRGSPSAPVRGEPGNRLPYRACPVLTVGDRQVAGLTP